jgi:hypothetical protein
MMPIFMGFMTWIIGAMVFAGMLAIGDFICDLSHKNDGLSFVLLTIWLCTFCYLLGLGIMQLFGVNV